MFNSPGKITDGRISIAMRYAVPHAVIKMSFQDDLSDFVQGIFGRINLNQHILTPVSYTHLTLPTTILV